MAQVTVDSTQLSMVKVVIFAILLIGFFKSVSIKG